MIIERDWNFNFFKLSLEDLFLYTTRSFYSKPFFTNLNLDESLFGTLVWKFVFYYNHNKNAFHNFLHGVSVFHAANYLLNSIDSLKSLILGFNTLSYKTGDRKYTIIRFSRDSDIKSFAFLLTALCHDLGHTSKTNSFEISTQSKLAIRYSDDSPLERHHTALMFKLCLQTIKKTSIDGSSKNVNIFSGLSRKEYIRIRKSIIKMILSTDMKYHFGIIQKFTNETNRLYDKENRYRASKPQNSTDFIEVPPILVL